MRREAQSLARGEAEGPALVLSEPLSFWGGIDVETGAIIDHSHPQRGLNVAGRVLVMPGGRGSSSSSAVLAEVIRLGTGPVAIVLATPDPILTVGAIVAAFLYGLSCPIAVCGIDGIASGDRLRVRAADVGPADVTLLDGMTAATGHSSAGACTELAALAARQCARRASIQRLQRHGEADRHPGRVEAHPDRHRPDTPARR